MHASGAILLFVFAATFRFLALLFLEVDGSSAAAPTGAGGTNMNVCTSSYLSCALYSLSISLLMLNFLVMTWRLLNIWKVRALQCTPPRLCPTRVTCRAARAIMHVYPCGLCRTLRELL